MRCAGSFETVHVGLAGRGIDGGLLPYSRCIAFEKEAEDTRSWDFIRTFTFEGGRRIAQWSALNYLIAFYRRTNKMEAYYKAERY
jgi:hypothetical protein